MGPIAVGSVEGDDDVARVERGEGAESASPGVKTALVLLRFYKRDSPFTLHPM